MSHAADVAPEDFERRAKTHRGQDMHHLVAVNHRFAEDARVILFNKGIPINSAFNGVALERIVHQYAANNETYVKTINQAIIRLKGASPAQVDEFLTKLSDRFLLLNDFVKSDEIAPLSYKQKGTAVKYEASSLITEWIREYPYP